MSAIRLNKINQDGEETFYRSLFLSTRHQLTYLQRSLDIGIAPEVLVFGYTIGVLLQDEGKIRWTILRPRIFVGQSW